MAAGGEFVEGWLVAQVLGEGAYGEVRLLVHARTGAAVALKVSRTGGTDAAREAALQRALRHPHVLRCLGERIHQELHYMFLEYAQGGELFDRIEPDVGMSESSARRYWRQLLAGLQYLHGRGVAHRDIKPENLLLDHDDNIKISDFGMATLFRHGSRERLLSRVCGTVPYAAPEVLSASERPYRAAPADLWAAGVVLLAMLAGELPWERANVADPRFAAWSAAVCSEGASNSATVPATVLSGAWRKLSSSATSLLRRALQPRPERRPLLSALMEHRWMQEHEGAFRVSRSQPAVSEVDGGGGDLSADDMDALMSYSQPSAADDMLLASQADSVGACTQPSVMQRLMRRMTRVWMSCDEQAALQALCAVLREKGFVWRHLNPRLLAIECSAELHMRAQVCAAGAPEEAGAARSQLEFRRARGCGLQFKRCFIQLRAALQPLAAHC
ncbi:serine/threonine-protein kinase grp [Achroia grisella]|uniref:serine/threonine-protein kinase grp n=1 Tax=Achroia grisella TaxID=688607 RepID=UPI0027D21A4D|nr:serine/threonine-protein kinase grp [Achroia grisella]XP_059049589.1 serine/threonine-protein kinase grp [Achroia grisella]